MNALDYPNEEALLCDWLRLSRPEGLKNLDLFAPSTEASGIWPERARYADEERALQNAVARIVLCAIQDRLPQVAFRRDDEIRPGRRYYSNPKRAVELLPQYLFLINWADNYSRRDDSLSRVLAF